MSGDDRRVALLRGINVGGVRVPAADLRALFRELGAHNVATVLATGNVIYRGQLSTAAIEAALSQRFDYPARVLQLDIGEMQAIETAFPFPEDSEHHSYIVFLDAPERFLENLSPAPEESVTAGEGVVYWRVPRGLTTTSPVGRAAARWAKTAFTTTRNVQTIRKMLAITL